MSRIKYTNRLNPWHDLDLLANRMNRLFGDPRSANPAGVSSSWVPAVNVEERGGDLLLTAELPGITEDSVEITLENNILTISGEKHERRDEGGAGRRVPSGGAQLRLLPPFLCPAALRPRRRHHR